MRWLGVLLLIGCGGARTPATTITADVVDRIVATVMAEAHVPGIAVAVVKDGIVHKARGYGAASLEWPSPVTTQTRFQIASSTKLLTGTLVMMLVEDRTLDLDRPIVSYLPDAPPAWSEMTLRQLAAHAGGVADYLDSRVVAVRDAYEAVKTRPLRFSPGSRVQYGTGDFIVLVHVLETVTKRSFEQLLEARIFQPLGFTCTSFEHETEDGDVVRVPDARLAVIVLTNQQKLVPNLAARIASEWLPPPVAIPIADPSPAVTITLRAVAERVQRGALLDEALFANPAELVPMLREWGPIQLAAMPPLDGFALVASEPTRRRYHATYGRVTGTWTFVLDVAGKVVDLDFAVE